MHNYILESKCIFGISVTYLTSFENKAFWGGQKSTATRGVAAFKITQSIRWIKKTQHTGKQILLRSNRDSQSSLSSLLLDWFWSTWAVKDQCFDENHSRAEAQHWFVRSVKTRNHKTKVSHKQGIENRIHEKIMKYIINYENS